MISLGCAGDVEKAVAAAKLAFPTNSETTLTKRLAFLQRIIEVYQSRIDEMAETI
jgi:aldehyde dehydrogenase (NAD+)